MADRFKLITAAYLLFRDGDKVLLSRRCNTGFMDGWYGLVSGHHDGEEPMTTAAIREAMEEAGVSIEVQDLTFRHVMHRRMNDERVDFFFEVRKWEGGIENREPHLCDALAWFPVDALPEKTIVYIRQAIENTEKGIAYSEYWHPE